MKSSWNLSQAGLALVMVPLAFQIVFFVVLLDLLNQAEQERIQEIHAKKVLTLVTNASKQVSSLMALAMLSTIAADARTIRNQELFIAQSKRTLEEMAKVKADSNEERQLLLQAIFRYKQVFKVIDELKGASLAELATGMEDAHGPAEQLEVAISRLVNYEYRNQSQTYKRHAATEVLNFGLAFNIIVAVILALLFGKFVAKRLSRISENSERLTAGIELYPPSSGTDEIARLDQSFHRMAEALTEAARRRVEAEQFRQQLFNMVSHDIRSPLTSLMASLNFITAGKVPGMPEEALDIIRGAEESSGRLLGMTRNLLDLEKMAGNTRLIIEHENVPVSAILLHSIEDVRGLAESRGINIQAQQSELLVNGDQDRLTQVLLNLLTNAIKFSPRSATISVDVEDTGNEILIRVTDKGKGIAARDIQRVFEPFEQCEGQDNDVGAGLGLAICKSIVEAHGGTIGAESVAGSGSSFWFSIPKANVDSD